MIEIIPPSRRYLHLTDWATIHSVFSWNNFFDPSNVSFGNLIAFNEYIIQPNFGFPRHPHENIEQVFIIDEGEFDYEDSLNNTGKLSEEWVQVISAGTGYSRYTYNKSTTPCRYLAAWFIPNERGTAPQCQQAYIDKKKLINSLVPIIGSSQNTHSSTNVIPLPIQSNTIISRTILENNSMNYESKMFESLFIYLVNGSAAFNGTHLNKGGYIRIKDSEKLCISTELMADIIFISM